VITDRKMTPRQQRFVDEYLLDLNATQAAVRAGYSARTAEQQGPRLLGNAGVAAAAGCGFVTKLEINPLVEQLNALYGDRMLAVTSLARGFALAKHPGPCGSLVNQNPHAIANLRANIEGAKAAGWR
jgi:hypothetical protein